MDTQDTSKDQPLRDDIRLLGRLLGETLQAEEGTAIYETCLLYTSRCV